MAESPEPILRLWRTLPELAKTTPRAEYAKLHTWLPNRGLRGLYAKAQLALNLAQLETLSGQKIFRAGPHAKGKLNLKAKGDFGHYNPAFIRWLTLRGIPGRRDAKLRREFQPVYDQFLRRTARGYFAAHQILSANPPLQAKAIERYDALMAAEQPAFAMQELFRADANRLEKDGHDWFEVNVAHGFWIRRHIDGTTKPCHQLLVALLETHDAKWLKINR